MKSRELRTILTGRFLRGYTVFLGMTGALLSLSFILICIDVLQEKAGAKAHRFAWILLELACVSLIPSAGLWLGLRRKPLPRLAPWLAWAAVSLAISLSLGAIAADYQAQITQ